MMGRRPEFVARRQRPTVGNTERGIAAFGEAALSIGEAALLPHVQSIPYNSVRAWFLRSGRSWYGAASDDGAMYADDDAGPFRASPPPTCVGSGPGFSNSEWYLRTVGGAIFGNFSHIMLTFRTLRHERR